MSTLTEPTTRTRVESDSMGKIEVPSNVYWGAQTQRSLLHFNIGRDTMPPELIRAFGVLNRVRRQLARYFTKYDVWLTPTTPRVAESWGRYNLGRTDIHNIDEVVEKIFWPVVQFTFPYNILGTPAISLPLAMNSAGLPIGIQLGGRPAEEHVILQLAAALEDARPWSGRRPPLYAGS